MLVNVGILTDANSTHIWGCILGNSSNGGVNLNGVVSIGVINVSGPLSRRAVRQSRRLVVTQLDHEEPVDTPIKDNL